MKPETIERLSALNRSFYQGSGEAFARTRAAAWPGWARLLDRFTAPISTLDLGCGHGRFLTELERRGLAGDYVGVDSSEALLELARRAHPEARFRCSDVTTFASAGRFDLVAAFGLLHHLPSFALRERFMASLSGRLAPNGIACVTFWRFADRPRFQARMLPWTEAEREDGDHLLAFAEVDGARYCHHASEDEIGALITASGMAEIERYSSDGESGDLNCYCVLRHRGAS